MSAVTDGGRTSRLLARPEAAAEPPARMASTRYWGMERSTELNESSTTLDSQAAIRPIPGPGSSAGPGLDVVGEGGVVTDTSTIILLETLTSVRPGQNGAMGGGGARASSSSIRDRAG